MQKYVSFNTLVGKTLTKVVNGGDVISFYCVDGSLYQQVHMQDCCESVHIEDIVGDLEDLVGSPIIQASEETNNDNAKDKYDESCTWTFYNICTMKGSVTIRWYGTSNGYYSESVDFIKLK
jgi:hypothetical protein